MACNIACSRPSLMYILSIKLTWTVEGNYMRFNHEVIARYVKWNGSWVGGLHGIAAE